MDLTRLVGVVPGNILAELPSLGGYGLNSAVRMAHFLGQCMEETGCFKVFVENLNYSGEALWKLFPRHFADADEAMGYARQPERIANRIYANRMGNGSEASGDGWKYRGRGAIQTSGRNAYAQLGKVVGVDLVGNPDGLLPGYAMVSAAVFFDKNGVWAVCDRGVNNDVIAAVTYKVNGGNLNLARRAEYTLRVWGLVS